MVGMGHRASRCRPDGGARAPRTREWRHDRRTDDQGRLRPGVGGVRRERSERSPGAGVRLSAPAPGAGTALRLPGGEPAALALPRGLAGAVGRPARGPVRAGDRAEVTGPGEPAGPVTFHGESLAWNERDGGDAERRHDSPSAFPPLLPATMRKAILIIDHGSTRTAANEMLACMAELVQAIAGPDVIV